MATCYYICNENTPDAQRLEIWDDKGKRDIWLVSRECPEPLGSDLTEEVSKWMIEEYYTEDDDHGDAFRYFDSETIMHDVTAENAIIYDGKFTGVLFINKCTGSLLPVLIGSQNVARGSERLSETHTLEKQSTCKLIRKSDN